MTFILILYKLTKEISMKNSIHLLALLLIISIFKINSQVTQEWVARYNGTGSYLDHPTAITVDVSGNVYVTGYSHGMVNFDYATIKYNSAGVQLWVQRYNGTGDSIDVASGIVVDNLGNVYVTGYSTGIGNSYDFVTIKYSSSGAQLWLQRYNRGPSSVDQARSIGLDGAGNVYVTGAAPLAGNQNPDYVTIKYSPEGDQQWISVYDNPNGLSADSPSAMAVDAAGNVYVTGSSFFTSAPSYLTVKYNTGGVEQWTLRYSTGGGDWNSPSAIVADNLGNSYVTGWAWGSIGSVKYNHSGAIMFSDRFYVSTSSHGNSISFDASGNIYVAGDNTTSGIVTKYNIQNVQEWTNLYSGTAVAIKNDFSGNVYVTGTTGSGANSDIITKRFSPSGVEDWSIVYNGTGNHEDMSKAIVVDAMGNIYVAGQSNGGANNLDFVTIKYSQLVGIQPISTEIPNYYSLSQNYPNPFNPSTKIKFQIPLLRGVSVSGGQGAFTSIIIYDALGQVIETLVNEQLNPGTYEVNWNAADHPSGIYFYRLSSGDFSQTSKMILIK